MRKPALNALRESTQSLHRELEQRMDLLSPALGIEDYRNKLRALFAWQQALTQAGPPACEWDPEIPLRLSWLRDDLSLGPSDSVAFSSPPPPRTRDEWWGASYVIEGSSLGGQVICRHLSGRFPDLPLRYFAGRGDQTGPRWIQFLGGLHEVSDQIDHAGLCAGAVSAFESLACALSEFTAS